MPREYVSGNARQTVPSAVRWSWGTLLSSPPTYCAGVRILGKIRETTSSLSAWFSMIFSLRLRLNQNRAVFKLEDRTPTPCGCGLPRRTTAGCDLIDHVVSRTEIGDEAFDVADRIGFGQKSPVRIREPVQNGHAITPPQW